MGMTLRIFGSLIATALLSACMTIGAKFDIAKVDELKPGVSTVADASRLLGPPTSESAMANNARLLQWQYSQGTIVGGNGAHVAILFGPDGVMQKVTHRFVIR